MHIYAHEFFFTFVFLTYSMSYVIVFALNSWRKKRETWLWKEN